MKSLINSKTGAMLLVLMALSGTTAWADVDDFVLSVRDITQPTASTIEFNLYLRDADNTQPFEFAALQMGLLLNSSIYGTGTLTVSYSNAGSGLDGDQQFVGSIDVVAPLAGYDGKTLIRLMANSIPPVPPGAGSGTVISSLGDGTLLAHFTITSSVSFTTNTRAGLEFCSGSAVSPLYPTVVYSYIDGNSTPLPVTPGLDAIVDGDPLLNATPPALFNVTGTGTYCVGGAGLPVGLDGSELNTAYTLYRDVDSVTTIPGTGSAITFGNQAEGTYTVYATNPAATLQMTGQAVITAVINTAGASSSTPTLCINTPLTAITHTTTGATGIGIPVNLPDGVDALWAADVITISGTPTEAGVFSYSIPLTGGCGTVSATGTITVNALPGAAGSISGSPSFTPGTSGVPYSVATIAAATSYIWSYSGTGITINGTGASVTLDFSDSATSGTVAVFGRNSCGDGSASTLDLSPSTKTLTLTSVFLEGLYDGSGTMRQASDDYGAHWPAGIADYISVELHNSSDYSIIEFSFNDIELTTAGTALATIPAEYSDLYFVTIKHRNHIETTTALPVSFSNSAINYSWDSASKAYGDNLKRIDESIDHYVIYGGDSNGDGVADGLDLIEVENGATIFSMGYLPIDLNGDGIVDALDLILVENNALNFVMIILP